MASDLQRVVIDQQARAGPVRPDLRAAVDVPTVTVFPAPPDAVVLAVCGEVDLFTATSLRGRLLEHVRSTWPKLVVDLSGVSFFGAAGIAVLLAVREAAETAGVRMCLVAHARVVLRPLMITGLDGLFEIYPEIADARLRMGDGAIP